MINIQIIFGKGEAQTTKEVTIDPDDITLGFLEDVELAQETGKWRDLFKPMAEMLGLAREEVRLITNKQFREIMIAIQTAATEQTSVPN